MNVPLSNFDESTSTHKFTNFSLKVKKKGIWFKNIELEYRKKKKLLLVRFQGSKSMELSKNYTRVVENQLAKLEKDFISPLIKNTNTNFIMNLSVDPQGFFSFKNIHLKIKIDCGQGIHMRDSFRNPFKVLLPFSLYISNMSFRGHKHKISVVEAEINLAANDLYDIVVQPVVAPRAVKQWYEIASIIYDEAKKEYRYEVNIPVIEGELYWDNKVDTIQMTVYDGDDPKD